MPFQGTALVLVVKACVGWRCATAGTSIRRRCSNGTRKKRTKCFEGIRVDRLFEERWREQDSVCDRELPIKTDQLAAEGL